MQNHHPPTERPTTVIISAKFASACPCCSTRIAVGSKVEWSRGEKARHVACAAKPGAVSVASAPARANVRRSAYRNGSGAGAAVRMPGYSSYCTDRADCGCYDCQ